MKVLIIGAGAVSEMFHIPASIELLGVDNVYVVDSNSNQLETIQNKFGLLNCYQNMQDCIAEIDFCILATPPHTHLNIIRNCLEHKKPVLCEKPIAISSTECSEIINLQVHSNILVALCHTYRFFPNRNYIRKKLLDGFFGDNLVIEVEEGDSLAWQSVTGYNFRKDLVPGGVLIDAGIHSLDFILWCLGSPINFNYVDDSLGGLESNCNIDLEFENNTRASFKLSRTNNLTNTIKIRGSLNQCEFSIFDMMAFKENTKHVINVENEQHVDWSNIASLQIEDFIQAFQSKSPVKCDLESGVKVVELIEQCYFTKQKRALPSKAILPGELF